MRTKLQRIISVTLACILLLALMPASVLAAGAEDHWSAGYIQVAIDRGWIEADDADPDKEVTRVEAAAILGKAVAGPVAVAEEAAASALTRQDAIMMLADAIGLEASDKTAAAGFADWADVSDSAQAAVAAVVEKGIVNGIGNNRLAPSQFITQGELIKIAVLACGDVVPVDGTISADDAIVGIETIGFVDVDGPKAMAIAVEYNVDLTGVDISADTYEIVTYIPEYKDDFINYENVGKINSVYVNDTPDISETGGTGTGNYVIIELNVDYVRTNEGSFREAYAAGVTQVKAIRCGGVVITANENEIKNYTEVSSYRGGAMQTTRSAIDGAYIVKGLDGYLFFTNDDSFPADGEPLVVQDAFDERDGTTTDFVMNYALWLPEDYDPNGSYALATVSMGSMDGTHPFDLLFTSYSQTYFISDEAQQIVKDAHGLDGMIVVVPTIESVDDNACVPAAWMGMCALWDYLMEEYAIDPNYVYGVGQSMGGMLLMQTNTSRDNFFAGMLCYGNQWGQNYYKDTVFARNMASETYNETAQNTKRHYPSTAGAEYIWDYHYDENGEKVYENHDPYNFYYMISDDNLMALNSSGNWLSLNLWKEASTLYSDLAGYSIPQMTGLNGSQTVDEQNAELNKFLEETDNSVNGIGMGLWEITWDTTENGSSAIWSRRMTAAYEWLLKQDRQTEMARAKLDINRPFELADEQLTDEAHTLDQYYDAETGEAIYFWTAKAGSGTRFYNSSCLSNNIGPADLNPGWLPDGMSWEVGVEAATIQSVKAIGSTGNYTAVAVEYDVDMENVLMHLVGDAVVNSKGEAYDDYFVTNPPFDFYDADGNKIDCEIINYYVNSAASAITGAERGSGSGNYVIIEFKTPTTVKPVGAIQRTTVITDTAISSATGKLYT